MLSIEQIIDSKYGEELFYAMGCDNPDGLLLRWIRAKKWNVNDTINQLMDTLKWRNEINIQKILLEGENELIVEELEKGTTYLLGRDKTGRPVTYVQLKNHIKGEVSNEGLELLTILTIETGRMLLDSGNETATVILDLNGFSMKNLDYDLIKFLINLLENHYPECLGIALVINAPFLFSSSWNLIKHWFDPVVQNKIQFLKDSNELTKYIDPSILPKHLNGTQNQFKYIPPNQQDQIMLSTFTNDQQGYQLAKRNHRKYAINYLNWTLQWANDQSNSQHLLTQRKKAQKKLRNAFLQLIPYVSTRTHYHRIGLINQSIFDTTYQHIISTNQQNVIHF